MSCEPATYHQTQELGVQSCGWYPSQAAGFVPADLASRRRFLESTKTLHGSACLALPGHRECPQRGRKVETCRDIMGTPEPSRAILEDGQAAGISICHCRHCRCDRLSRSAVSPRIEQLASEGCQHSGRCPTKKVGWDSDENRTELQRLEAEAATVCVQCSSRGHFVHVE